MTLPVVKYKPVFIIFVNPIRFLFSSYYFLILPWPNVFVLYSYLKSVHVVYEYVMSIASALYACMHYVSYVHES